MLLGTIKQDTQIKGIKIAKRDKANAQNHPGLGRKFRLARPLLGSGANIASPEPVSRSQASNARRLYL